MNSLVMTLSSERHPVNALMKLPTVKTGKIANEGIRRAPLQQYKRVAQRQYPQYINVRALCKRFHPFRYIFSQIGPKISFKILLT